MKSVVYALAFISLLGIVNAGWQLTFADEFNGQSKLNTDAWNTFYSYSPRIINNELQWYYPGAFNFTSTTRRIVVN